jgi:hypothetical protein
VQHPDGRDRVGVVRALVLAVAEDARKAQRYAAWKREICRVPTVATD